MSAYDILDAYEAADTVYPCPSDEGLRRDWCEEVIDTIMPWSEIEHESTYETQAFLEECLTVFFDMASSVRWKELRPLERVANIERLMTLPQIPQRTTEWYAQAKTVLTASEFATILGTQRAAGVLAMQKAAPPTECTTNRLACSTTEMSAMDWGVRFEPVVKQILTALWGAELVELGRIVAASDARLAASPDGAIIAAEDPARVGRLVEIKCPIRREVTGQIPFEYWCQMQIQMEVCDVDECEYVEVKINSGYKDKPMCTDTEKAGTQRHLFSGTVWLLQEPDTLELKYAYTALELKDLERAGWNVVETIPWNLDGIFIQVVARDRSWFAGTAVAREAFWAKVAEVQAGTYVLPATTRAPRAPKPAGLVVNVCKIED
jgi:hypothetical protein